MAEPVSSTESGAAPSPPVQAAPELPRARIERSRTGWLFWLFPIAAAALCLWFVYRDFIRVGPTITIYFRNADGLEEDNTLVRYRGAKVGSVKSVALMPDAQSVKVRVQLDESAANLARAGSVYWIVRPELRVGSVSGLRTIVSGEYIAVEPGTGERATTFDGAEHEPTVERPGDLRIVLLSPELSTLQEASPISYRGIEVGEVRSYRLGTNSQEVVITASIREQYALLVRRNSVFWNAGRFNVSWGLFRGAQIGADSPAALLTGAIEFATPPDLLEAATNGSMFRLNDKAKDDWKTWAPAIRLPPPPAAGQASSSPGSK